MNDETSKAADLLYDFVGLISRMQTIMEMLDADEQYLRSDSWMGFMRGNCNGLMEEIKRVKLENAAELNVDVQQDNDEAYQQLGLADYEGKDGLAHHIRNLQERVERLREALKWVSVNERPPEEGRYLAMAVGTNCLGRPMAPVYLIAYYWCKADPKGWRDEEYMPANVTHWMSLPPPPAAGSIGDNDDIAAARRSKKN